MRARAVPTPRLGGELPRELALQLLDARSHDVDQRVELLAGDAERRRQADDLAARVDDGAAIPRLAIDLRHLGAVERPAGAIRRDELGADHETAAAHLAHDATLADRLG